MAYRRATTTVQFLSMATWEIWGHTPTPLVSAEHAEEEQVAVPLGHGGPKTPSDSQQSGDWWAWTSCAFDSSIDNMIVWLTL